MYKFERYRQIGLADFNQPLGLKMNPENRWVNIVIPFFVKTITIVACLYAFLNFFFSIRPIIFLAFLGFFLSVHQYHKNLFLNLSKDSRADTTNVAVALITQGS